MSVKAVLKSGFSKPILFILCLIPLSALIWKAFYGGLGANPVEAITHETGEWTLRFLLLTLLISPIQKWSKIAAWVRFRRMLGLYAFFYALCHFSVWFLADHSLEISAMLDDVIDRPYITLGFAALLVMLPLAATSNQWMVKKLARRWITLHKSTYAVLVLGVAHYLWLVKADYLEAGIYTLIAVVLLGSRLVPFKAFQSRQAKTSS